MTDPVCCWCGKLRSEHRTEGRRRLCGVLPEAPPPAAAAPILFGKPMKRTKYPDAWVAIADDVFCSVFDGDRAGEWSVRLTGSAFASGRAETFDAAAAEIEEMLLRLEIAIRKVRTA